MLITPIIIIIRDTKLSLCLSVNFFNRFLNKLRSLEHKIRLKIFKPEMVTFHRSTHKSTC